MQCSSFRGYSIRNVSNIAVDLPCSQNPPVFLFRAAFYSQALACTICVAKLSPQLTAAHVIANHVVDVMGVDPPLRTDSEHGEDEAVRREVVGIWRSGTDNTSSRKQQKR